MARPRQVSDAELLATARSCFLAHGPAVSTTVIAREVGLSQAALFKRFGTKEDLMFAALLPPEVPDWVAHVARGPDERPIPVQLVDIAHRIAAFFEEMTPCLMTIKASGADMLHAMSRYEVPPPARGRRALAAWFRTAHEQGRLQDCEPESVAYMFVGSLHGRAFLTYIGGSDTLSRASFIESMVATLWRGLDPGRPA